MPPKTQMVPSAWVAATASRATRASAIGSHTGGGSAVGWLGASPPVSRDVTMYTPLMTSSSAAAAAAAAIRIFLRFFLASGLTVVVLGSPTGAPTGHLRLDWLIDAVWANMLGSGAGNPPACGATETDSASIAAVCPLGPDIGTACGPPVGSGWADASLSAI